MPRVPRRLRNLNFDVEGVQNEQQDEGTSQGPQEFDAALGMRPELNRSIKIVWPNGTVREIFTCLRTTELLNLNGGKVVVETDENGIPNQRSQSILSSYLGELAQNSSFAPLHIPRWDSKLFKQPKQNIITDVEEKFVYPTETKLKTRVWILKTVSKRWRDYKSDLKKKYYNPNERTLVQIEKDSPDGVNENQWSALLGIWCSEAHKKLCRKNAECAKKQRHPHTTGRKSHARLKKEMEDKKKEKISRIDLWDESHKKKNGDYVNENVQRLMDKAYDDLANRRHKNGSLSSRDYDDVFQNVIRNELTVHQYYGDEYWSQGSDSCVRSEVEKELQRQLQLVTSEFEIMRAFLDKKFPGDNWRNTSLPAESAPVNDRAGNQIIPDEHFHTGESDSNHNIQSPTNYEQMHAENCTNANQDSVEPVLSSDNVVAKQAHDVNCMKVINEGSKGSSSPHKEGTAMARQSKILKQNMSQQKIKKVLLLSMNVRNKGRIAAIGNLITRDNTHEVGGIALGDEYWCVVIHCLSNIEDERLPRPYGDIQTVEDAVGCSVAWPRTHIKRVKNTPKKRAKKDDQFHEDPRSMHGRKF